MLDTEIPSGLGTPTLLSPEVIHNNKETDGQTDNNKDTQKNIENTAEHKTDTGERLYKCTMGICGNVRLNVTPSWYMTFESVHFPIYHIYIAIVHLYNVILKYDPPVRQ